MTNSKSHWDTWTLEQLRERVALNQIRGIAVSRSLRDEITRREQDVTANPGLIAAAPDLLAALADIVRCAKMNGPIPGTTVYFISDDRMAAARAAVAKARGV